MGKTTTASDGPTRNLTAVIAISIVAFAIANFLHEGVGHGGACLLTGGHGVGNFGDWADVIAGLTPDWLWRAGLTVMGAVSYVLVVWLALLELRPFLAERDWRRGGAKDLTIVPYVTGAFSIRWPGFSTPWG